LIKLLLSSIEVTLITPPERAVRHRQAQRIFFWKSKSLKGHKEMAEAILGCSWDAGWVKT